MNRAMLFGRGKWGWRYPRRRVAALCPLEMGGVASPSFVFVSRETIPFALRTFPLQKAGLSACLFCLFHDRDIFAKQLKSSPEQDIMDFTAVKCALAIALHARERGVLLWAKPLPSSTKRAASVKPHPVSTWPPRSLLRGPRCWYATSTPRATPPPASVWTRPTPPASTR